MTRLILFLLLFCTRSMYAQVSAYLDGALFHTTYRNNRGLDYSNPALSFSLRGGLQGSFKEGGALIYATELIYFTRRFDYNLESGSLGIRKHLFGADFLLAHTILDNLSFEVGARLALGIVMRTESSTIERARGFNPLEAGAILGLNYKVVDNVGIGVRCTYGLTPTYTSQRVLEFGGVEKTRAMVPMDGEFYIRYYFFQN